MRPVTVFIERFSVHIGPCCPALLESYSCKCAYCCIIRQIKMMMMMMMMMRLLHVSLISVFFAHFSEVRILHIFFAYIGTTRMPESTLILTLILLFHIYFCSRKQLPATVRKFCGRKWYRLSKRLSMLFGVSRIKFGNSWPFTRWQVSYFTLTLLVCIG